MGYLYTWHDVERFLYLEKRNQWHEKWSTIDVYSDEVIITVENNFSEEDQIASEKILVDLFKQHYQKDKIILDYYERTLDVKFVVNEWVDGTAKKSLPLFKELDRNIGRPQPLKGVRVIAFHSFKGGVGRTLSMIAAARSLSMMQKNSGSYRLLIVDADLEAPGLTWLAAARGMMGDISFLDALAIVHEDENWRADALHFITKKVQETVFRLQVGQQEVEHYFLPAYRETEQMIALPITPEHLIQMTDREWIMADFLSELGQMLEVDAVLVDLRAGISEFASPLLFDPRVQKVFVTSTSLQSRCGLKTMLDQIYEKPLQDEDPSPTIFISMVPDELGQEERFKMEAEFYGIEEKIREEHALEEEEGTSLGLTIHFLPFAQNLVHLEGFDTIDSKLAGTPMSKQIDRQVLEWFAEEETSNEVTVNRADFLRKLINITEEMEYAESNSFSKFLTTLPLANIAKKYRFSVPISVILGAKGSGKTFAYFQLLHLNTWEEFINKIEANSAESPKTFVVPFLKPKNLPDKATKTISERLRSLRDSIGFKMNLKDMDQRFDMIETFNPDNHTEAEWKSFWRKQLLDSTGLGYESWDELQNDLFTKNKRVVFIVDGLEELFLKPTEKESERIAIRALCQGVINELRSYPEGRIGLVIFIRRDLAMNSIQQNWGQFATQYSPFELRWTNTEALRLTLWVASQVDPLFLSDIPIEKTTGEFLEERLYPLWGYKLGKPQSKEGRSASWILSALADFNKQLQARDIIRFLHFAADKSLTGGISSDRYLSPAAVRYAIKPCSERKIKEIEEEIKILQPIFQKLTIKLTEQRKVPFQLKEYKLTDEEAKLLEQHGFLVQLNDGYYMPEIIRYGLGFSLQRGARPKVLALLKQSQR